MKGKKKRDERGPGWRAYFRNSAELSSLYPAIISLCHASSQASNPTTPRLVMLENVRYNRTDLFFPLWFAPVERCGNLIRHHVVWMRVQRKRGTVE
jgi:hypothetical protein